MPARLDHLPNHYERSILQKLRERGGADQIADAGGRTTIRLRRVGLNTVAARFYRITQLGSEALVAKMPVDKASEGNDANE